MKWLRPQKPQDYEPDKKAHKTVMIDNSEWDGEPKWDGWRCFVTRDKIFSATGKPLEIPWLYGLVPKGMMIDAETLGEDTDVSTDVATLIAHHPELLILKVFDVVYKDGDFFGNEKLSNRKNYLGGLFHDGVFKDQRITETEIVRQNKQAYLDKMFNLGKEGMVFKHRDSLWKSGSRVGWVKVKATYMIDVVIVDAKGECTPWTVEPGKIGKDGILYPDGKRSKSWLAGHVCPRYGFYDLETKELRIVGSLGESGPPEEMEKWVGKVVEVKGYGKEPLPTGAIRHPQFQRLRDDKFADECVFDFKNGKLVQLGS